MIPAIKFPYEYAIANSIPLFSDSEVEEYQKKLHPLLRKHFIEAARALAKDMIPLPPSLKPPHSTEDLETQLVLVLSETYKKGIEHEQLFLLICFAIQLVYTVNVSYLAPEKLDQLVSAAVMKIIDRVLIDTPLQAETLKVLTPKAVRMLFLVKKQGKAAIALLKKNRICMIS